MRKAMHRLMEWLCTWLQRFFRKHDHENPIRRKRMRKSQRHLPRKPAWVIEEVIRIHHETGFGFAQSGGDVQWTAYGQVPYERGQEFRR